jgi:UDPglucose--hexose-1-phosphate uridylyltransferase
MPELRRNPITKEWVIIATERGQRPQDFKAASEDPSTRQAFEENCPFCPGHEHMTPPEVLAYRRAGRKDGSGWWVRVVPNKFPALAIEGDLDRHGYGMYDRMNGVGAHEVIVETPEHNKCVATIAPHQAEEVVWAYRERYLDLQKDVRFKYILIFRNQGRAAGASLVHPHSQLIALPFVPSQIRLLLMGARDYHGFRERCIYCDMVHQESHYGRRVVAENERFIAFVPFAPKYAFETWIVPKVHNAHFAGEDRDGVRLFARILQQTLHMVGAALNHPPYNYTLHTAPFELGPQEVFHWHLTIMPRLAIAAGFEMGSGIYINTVPPENAAEYLRAAAKPPGAPAPDETDEEIAEATAHT